MFTTLMAISGNIPPHPVKGRAPHSHKLSIKLHPRQQTGLPIMSLSILPLQRKGSTTFSATFLSYGGHLAIVRRDHHPWSTRTSPPTHPSQAMKPTSVSVVTPAKFTCEYSIFHHNFTCPPVTCYMPNMWIVATQSRQLNTLLTPL